MRPPPSPTATFPSSDAKGLGCGYTKLNSLSRIARRESRNFRMKARKSMEISLGPSPGHYIFVLANVRYCLEKMNILVSFSQQYFVNVSGFLIWTLQSFAEADAASVECVFYER